MPATHRSSLVPDLRRPGSQVCGSLVLQAAVRPGRSDHQCGAQFRVGVQHHLHPLDGLLLSGRLAVDAFEVDHHDVAEDHRLCGGTVDGVQRVAAQDAPHHIVGVEVVPVLPPHIAGLLDLLQLPQRLHRAFQPEPLRDTQRVGHRHTESEQQILELCRLGAQKIPRLALHGFGPLVDVHAALLATGLHHSTRTLRGLLHIELVLSTHSAGTGAVRVDPLQRTELPDRRLLQRGLLTEPAEAKPFQTLLVQVGNRRKVLDVQQRTLRIVLVEPGTAIDPVGDRTFQGHQLRRLVGIVQVHQRNGDPGLDAPHVLLRPPHLFLAGLGVAADNDMVQPDVVVHRADVVEGQCGHREAASQHVPCLPHQHILDVADLQPTNFFEVRVSVGCRQFAILRQHVQRTLLQRLRLGTCPEHHRRQQRRLRQCRGVTATPIEEAVVRPLRGVERLLADVHHDQRQRPTVEVLGAPVSLTDHLHHVQHAQTGVLRVVIGGVHVGDSRRDVDDRAVRGCVLHATHEVVVQNDVVLDGELFLQRQSRV